MQQIFDFIGLYPLVVPGTMFEILQWLLRVGISMVLILLIFKWIFSLSGYITGRKL